MEKRVGEFWKNKKILVTGGGGFIGSFVVDNLINQRGVDPANIVIPRSHNCDLRIFEQCRKAVQGCQVIVHLAAQTGGIAYSRSHAASQYRNCSLIDLNIIESARLAGVEKIISIGNILVYPKTAPQPLREEDVFNGKVAETHLGIGAAKRNLLLMAEMYYREFGMDVTVVLSANAYGPRDRFDPTVSHVIPATIIKCFGTSDMVVWGDGTPTRDFLYVEDVAEGLLLAAEKLRGPQYVNIGSGDEVSIRELVHHIARLTGFAGKITFDASKGGGDPRRVSSTRKADELLGFKPRFALEDGLKKTIAWYRSVITGGNEKGSAPEKRFHG